MKLVLFLVFCTGFALARVEEWSWLDEVEPSRTIEDSEFQTGREFHYFYNGQMTTGIPGSSKQHSGTRIQALVTFVFKSSNVCLMKLNNIRMGKMNRDLPNPRKIVPFDSFEEVEVEQRHKEKLQLPIKFSYKGGLITKVVFDGEEQPWSANIKRGIMNLIQVDLQQQKSLDSIDQRLTNTPTTRDNEDSVFYRVMEETIEGECETLYTITKQPNMKFRTREVLNVTKSVNFEKCKKRPHVKYNFRFSDPCPTCESKYNEDEKFLKSSTVAFYNITGTVRNFLIDSARVESEYTFVPFNEDSNVIVTYVNQTLVLIKTSPVSNRVEEPRRQVESDSDMIYTLDWEVAKEKFHMEDDSTFLRKLLSTDVSRKVEMVGTLLEKLVRKMKESVEDDAPKYFERLVALFRLCTKQEIDEVHNTYYRTNSKFNAEEQKKIRDILPHAHALSGTKTCVQHLVERIRTNEVPTFTAVLALKQLNNMRTPSKEIIQELLKFTETDLVERNFALKQATLLTIGSLMNALCSNSEDQWAREFKETTEQLCPRQLKERYVRLLVEKLESTNKWEERMTYLKTLGNAGLDISIFDLEKIILNRDGHYSTMLRIEAVLATRQLRNTMPKKIVKVLMPILMNKLEPPTLRIACSYMILQTLPERPVLDQMAKLVHNERSLQVASFVHSYMHVLANSTNPCEKKLATEMRLALRHTRNINTSPFGYSKLYRLSMHNTHHKFGMDWDVESSFSNTSFIPHYMVTVLHSNFLGFWNKYLVTLGFVNEGLENIVRRFYIETNLFEDHSLDDIWKRGPRATPLSDYERELRTILQSMNIRTRDYDESTQEPKALFYMKFKDQDYGFLPIKEEMIRSWIEENNFNRREIKSKLSNGVTVNFNKATILHEMLYTIPTTVGLPLSVTIKVPLVMSVNGNLRAVSTSERSLKSFKINAELKPSMVATMVVDIECWSPVVNHGLKVVNKLKFFQPIDAKVEVDLLAQPKTVKVTVRPPTTRRELLSLESRPVTYTRTWTKFVTSSDESDEKTVMGEEMNRVNTFNKCFGRKTFGVEMCLRGQVHKTPAKSVTGTPFFPLSGPNKVMLTVEPGHETPEEIVITLTGKLMQPTETTSRPTMIQDFDTSSSFEDERITRRTERSTERDSREEDATTYTSKKSLSNKLSISVDARSRKFTFDLNHVYDLAGRFGKLQMKMARSPVPEDSEPYMACWESESLFPNTPNVARQIKNDKVMTSARLTWGRTCQSDNYITLKTKALKSSMQNKYESETPEYRTYENCQDKSWCSPLSQKEFLDDASDLLKYQVEVDYNNVPVSVQNYTNKLFMILKNHYFEQADIAQIMVRNPEKKIRATVTIDPITKQHINVTIKTPYENTTIHDIATPFVLTPVNTKQSYLKNLLDTVDDDTLTATCHVSSRRINTFDDVDYSVPMSTCFAILAKDCSSDPSFVVMMRKLTESSDRKEIKIISRTHKIALAAQEDDRIKVNINDNEYRLTEEEVELTEQGYPLVGLVKEGSQVKVELLTQGVTVNFDGYATNIELSHLYRNKQCGLCGHFDMEPNDEFRNPDLSLTEDVREFYTKYITKGKDCKYPETNTMCTDAGCSYKPYWETTDEIQSSYERLTDDEPVMKRKLVETETDLCVSVSPVPQCPDNTYAKSKVEKRVQYKCLDRHDPKALEYQRRIRYEQTVFEVEDATDTITRTELVPTKCVPLY